MLKQITGSGQSLAHCDSSDDRKAAAKAGYLERRKQKKAQELATMEKEQSQMLSRNLPKLKDLLKSSTQDMNERRAERLQLRKTYDEHVALRKYKHNVKKRLEQASQNIVAVEINKFAHEMLFRKTDDEAVYTYQRKLARMMQYQMMWKQWLPIGLGLGLFKLTRRLKSKSPTDIVYFAAPFLYSNYGIFCVEQKTLFESVYPAHPYVVEKRMQVINKTCFSYPQIVKNEIEYLHMKLSEHHAAKMEEQESEGDQEPAPPLKFERVFTIGEVTSDYSRLLLAQAKKEVKETKEEEAKKLLKFKIIVEDGELYLQCIDPFEQIFEISRDSIENLELTDLLDPYMFDSHRDIINALFEVYYALSQDYLKVFHFDKEGTQATSLADRATRKLRLQYNLDEGMNPEDDDEKKERARKTIRETSSRV